MRLGDTIVAPITAAGGAVAVVRVSGEDAWQVAESWFGRWPEPPESHRAQFVRFGNGDEGLALPFSQGHGYTGEFAVEASIHGSPASVRWLIEESLAAGARLAEPGEFTMRALMNGRLDLAQAEAVRDTVAAQTVLQLRFANRQRGGALSARVEELRDWALAVLAAVEASVDFSDEVGEFDRDGGLVKLENLGHGIDLLLATEETGRIVRRGLRIAIVGEPNAGKSSLLNALVGRDRAIVTDIPGTTRDTIEAFVDLGGIPCMLVDTAGIRDSSDAVEREGVARAHAAAREADFVWHVHDSTKSMSQVPTCDLVIWNKIDLPDADPAPQGSVALSAVTRQNVDRLGEWVSEKVDAERWDVVIDPRHGHSLREARQAVTNAMDTIRGNLPDDLLATCLRTAIQSLGEITGQTCDAEMLERVFRDFCVGK